MKAWKEIVNYLRWRNSLVHFQAMNRSKILVIFYRVGNRYWSVGSTAKKLDWIPACLYRKVCGQMTFPVYTVGMETLGPVCRALQLQGCEVAIRTTDEEVRWQVQA